MQQLTLRFLPADLQAVSRDGMTPVHYAAAAGHRALMELLLEQGAALDAKAADDSTPLLLAAGGWLCCAAGCVPLSSGAATAPVTSTAPKHADPLASEARACVPLPAPPIRC